MLSLFSIIVISMARQMNKNAINVIRLKFENEDLVQYLGQEKERVEKLNRDLESEINERKKTEEALEEREKQYKAIFISATDGFLILDRQGRIVEANPQACAIHRYNYNEFIGLHSRDILHPDYRHIIAQIPAGN